MVNAQQIVNVMAQGLVALAVTSMAANAVTSVAVGGIAAGATKEWPSTQEEIDRAVDNYRRRLETSTEKAVQAYRYSLEKRHKKQ